MTSRPSIKTVAAAAGVSPATVSNAYNRPEQLSGAVRERILDVADRMGYAGPDPTASSLRSRRTGSIGMLFAQALTYAFDDPYCTTLLAGIADVATEAGSNILLMPVGPHVSSRTYSRDEEMRLVHGVRRAAVDGAIADGVQPDHPMLRVLAERDVPLVRTTDEGGGRSVVVDDAGAGRALGEHLRSLGHRRVAFVADSTGDGRPRVEPADHRPLFPYARRRLEGVREALEPHEVMVVDAGTNTARSGRRAVDAILARDPWVTAVVATSDVLALGVLEALRSRGVRPGVDVSVTGFDDLPQAAQEGLTTVHQPVREKGRTLGRMLLDPSFTAHRVLLPTELVVRTTTGTAPHHS
ncbi:LacI family DNA-binding transcriptional regulator [Isoptericola cucumis]|uniref:LacI family transcriptional regulator n=1 Tax=Isoptericola cucumis TaxID=1776856 RepID=A0ABQ2BAL2_9MICO|nr:LacI family DNA-binding transcriptional regulator [Isoptericola cucumis]GGI11712.1 LacI family transcriptional regulator [Isoptericola cucumis]